MNSKIHRVVLGIILTACFSACTTKNDQADGSVQQEVNSTTGGESIYQLAGEWHTQHNDTMHLSQLRGKTPVIAMGFTHCGYACPRLVMDMKQIEAQVPERKKGDVVFVLASFDTERDQPERLRAFANEMALSEDWLLLHGDEETVRELSMVLDVKYKKQADGNFAHSNSITLLNTHGEIVEQLEGLGTDAAPILTRLE